MSTPQISSRSGTTLGSVLADGAARTPDATFLCFEREPGLVETTTWQQMAARARGTAAALRELGVGPGDRVGVHLTNCPGFYDVWFGAALLGAAIVPTNPLSTVDELRYIHHHAGCRVVVTEPDLRATVEAAGAGLVLDITGGWAHDDAAGHDLPSVPADSVAAVLYTSGTTSKPKGVLVTHAAYLHAGDVVAGHLRLRPEDRHLVVLPLFHGNAQYYSTMSALVTGASIGLAPRFTASRWSAQAVALRATVASLFAAPIRMILAHEPSDNDRAHALRAVLFAQNVSAAQADAFESRFAVPLLQLYGMTETVFPPLMNPLYERRDAASMGRPVTGARVRLIDEEGHDVAPGEPGQLLVAGEPGRTVMAAYLDDPVSTDKTLVSGWLHTGDVARADADGYLYFVDRAKDMIKRAGENVSCGEVESVVNTHPAVFESAAVGVPDEMRDEALIVFVVVHNGQQVTAEELIALCRDRLAKFKVPDSVEFVTDLPRTSVGKIQKHLLRQRLRPAPGP
ncbi:MAG TPA: AMP-binding protein [Amycolatopsis sp.]|nr:AMP-binding protein [Amycolatopsis sp.]